MEKSITLKLLKENLLKSRNSENIVSVDVYSVFKRDYELNVYLTFDFKNGKITVDKALFILDATIPNTNSLHRNTTFSAIDVLIDENEFDYLKNTIKKYVNDLQDDFKGELRKRGLK